MESDVYESTVHKHRWAQKVRERRKKLKTLCQMSIARVALEMDYDFMCPGVPTQMSFYPGHP